MKSLNQRFFEVCRGTDECLKCKSYESEVEKLRRELEKLRNHNKKLRLLLKGTSPKTKENSSKFKQIQAD